MIEPLSCLNKDPFIRLGDGQAPVLNYNLPQETCFKVYGRIPFVVPKEYFKKETNNIPAINFWDLYKDKYENEIISDLNGQLVNYVFSLHWQQQSKVNAGMW
ncbi:MAG: hypothetical protein NVV82_29660 [Sporocytophaga sp.]|nr:hypothetical protein [Sporocytophaga sp.]